MENRLSSVSEIIGNPIPLLIIFGDRRLEDHSNSILQKVLEIAKVYVGFQYAKNIGTNLDPNQSIGLCSRR